MTTRPLRYLTTLKEISKSKTIYLSNSHKGGRIIIIEKHIYLQQMNDLDDDNIYDKIYELKIIKETKNFKTKPCNY